jgi:hypothetical protein
MAKEDEKRIIDLENGYDLIIEGNYKNWLNYEANLIERCGHIGTWARLSIKKSNNNGISEETEEQIIEILKNFLHGIKHVKFKEPNTKLLTKRYADIILRELKLRK